MSDPRPIEPAEVGRFGIDDQNNLYWDNRIVHTETSLKLTKREKVFATAVAIAAIMGTMASISNATVAWLTYHRAASQGKVGTPTSRLLLDSTVLCDRSRMYEAGYQHYSSTSDLGGQSMTEKPPSGGAAHVCSYEINNGAAAQDVGLFLLDTDMSSLGNAPCADIDHNISTLIVAYHLGPYEHISRGSGMGQIYSVPPGKTVCFQRIHNHTSPVEVAFTYTVF